ncbi:MAG: rhodanese-like domain-containing protein [Proteobacteria bacterium]|nr:rhodanese-like domain-containing protein [Pseudomonadota bacterium]
MYALLLPPAFDQFKDDLAGASRLHGDEVKAALSGNSQTRWRSSPDGKAVIVSAATPIWFDNKVVGAVVVEETTNNIQIMQRQVLAGLFNKTLLIFFVIVLLLLLFASRISSRLIKLNREATGAIDEYGKVTGKFTASNSSDEIGELSGSFSSMLERLQQYHIYLEGMVGRLSHELRTPMAIVKSSLDRLQQEQDDECRKEALQAANTGLQRLQTLLTRLTEAARLEQALQEAEKQKTNLNVFLSQCIEGYRLAYPNQSFNLITPDTVLNYEINRVAKDTFIELIKKSTLQSLKFSDAEALVDEGAQWLDVRFPNEHQESSIDGSINIPLNALRLQIDKLDTSKKYILFCDTGGRSSTGAFLLTGHGIDVSFLEGGLVNNPEAVGIQTVVPKAPKPVESKQEELDADVQVEILNAKLETTQIKMKVAEKPKDDADDKKKKEYKESQKKLLEEGKKIAESAQQVNEADLIKKNKEEAAFQAQVLNDLADFEDKQQEKSASVSQIQMHSDQMKRIMAKAAEAKRKAATADENLLSDISKQLGKK